MEIRRPPFVFTEHGVLMLSSVLNSPQSIKVNIQIMRIFVRMREMLLTHKDLPAKMEKMEQLVSSHDHQIVVLFEHLKRLLEDKSQ